MRSLFFLIFISGFLCFCKSSGYENKSTQDASKDPVKASMLGNDLPKDLRSEVNYFQTCKETIKVCSASKKTANECDWASLLVEHFPNEYYRTNSVVGVANPKICQENQACISYYLSCKYNNFAQMKKLGTIEAGSDHTCVLLDNGQVTCFGNGYSGQLGYGNNNYKNAPGDPITLPEGRSAKMIAAGDLHTCVLLDDGQVTCFGYGANGQLGYGDNSDRNTPDGTITFPAGRSAKTIAAGSNHTCILLDNGEVTCFGDGAYGQLGYGGNSDRNTPDGTINLGNAPDGTPYSVFSP